MHYLAQITTDDFHGYRSGEWIEAIVPVIFAQPDKRHSNLFTETEILNISEITHLVKSGAVTRALSATGEIVLSLHPVD